MRDRWDDDVGEVFFREHRVALSSPAAVHLLGPVALLRHSVQCSLVVDLELAELSQISL